MKEKTETKFDYLGGPADDHLLTPGLTPHKHESKFLKLLDE